MRWARLRIPGTLDVCGGRKVFYRPVEETQALEGGGTSFITSRSDA